MSERRRFDRILGPFEVHCLEPNTTRSEMVASDLSEAGCFLNAVTPPVTEPGDRCRLVLLLSGERIEVMAAVVYREPHQGVGLKFVDVPDETRQRLSKALAARR